MYAALDAAGSESMSDVIPPSKCLVCGDPARLAIGAEDVYAAHCSNACASAQWEMERLMGRIQVVTELTEQTLDEALSTTGIAAGEEAS